ncbi:MAG: hypothetical protein V5A34_11455 [Halapricum sp.]
MDDEHPLDRLPTDRIRGSIPGIGSEDEPVDDETGDAAEPFDDRDGDAGTGSALREELEGSEPRNDGPSRREQARKVLLGVSIGGVGLGALAALLRRLLGGSEDEAEADEAKESKPEAGEARTDEPEPPAPDAEAVAAAIGLGFQLVVRAVVGSDESESSTG